MSQQYGAGGPARVPDTQVLPASEAGGTQAIPAGAGRAEPVPYPAATPAPEQWQRPAGDVARPRPGYAAGPERPGVEPTAVGSLVAGLAGIVVPLVGILAIILGGIGLDRTRRRGTGGRGLATTGMTLGSVQVVLTTALVIGAWALWNQYGDDVERGLEQANQLAEADFSVPELLLGGLTDGVSLGDLQELAGTVGDVDELRGLAELCGSGDAAACQDVLDRVPDGFLPEELSATLPADG